MTVSEQEDELHFRLESDFEYFQKFSLVHVHLNPMVGLYIVNINLTFPIILLTFSSRSLLASASPPHLLISLSSFIPILLIMVGSYIVASSCLAVYSVAVDTLFLCFLKVDFVKTT